MNLIAVALSLLVSVFASSSKEAALIFTIEAADAQCQEIGELIAPHLFQNGFDKVIQANASRIINENWRFKVNASLVHGTSDHCSKINVKQSIYVYPEATFNTPDRKPAYAIIHRAQYDNVLESIEERANYRNHAFILNNGVIDVKLC